MSAMMKNHLTTSKCLTVSFSELQNIIGYHLLQLSNFRYHFDIVIRFAMQIEATFLVLTKKLFKNCFNKQMRQVQPASWELMGYLR